MEREPVTSSNIEAVGYDPETEAMEVEFKGGAVYRYEGVSAEIHQSVMDSPSVGRALGMLVKGKFRCEKVE